MTYFCSRSIKSLYLFSLINISIAHAQINPVADSLNDAILNCKVDSQKVKIYNVLFSELRSYNPTQAIKVAEAHLLLAQQIKMNKEIANANSNIGSGNYSLGNYSEALLYGFKALKLREILGNTEDVAASLSNIGLVYNHQNQFALALKYHQKALQLRLNSNNKKGMSNSYNNIGLAYLAMNNDSLARINFLKSLNLKIETKDLKGKAQALNNLATVYTRQELLEKALEFLFQSLSIKQELNDKNGMASSYDNIGDVYVKKAEKNNTNSDYIHALSFYNKSLKIARELKLKEVIKVCCESLASVEHKLGDEAAAYSYIKEYALIKDTLFNETIARSTSEMQNKYQSEKQEKEIALLNHNKLLAASTEKTQRIIIISGILFTIISLGFLFNRYRVKQRANNLLTQKNKLIDKNRSELRKQKEIIEQKNQDITDSIEYAKNVQSLILPSETELRRTFPESFVLFRPKAIVSGDFYWYYKTERTILLAVIDCTGHGIPGAMMSFLGFNLLENVVKTKGIKDPSQILQELNREVFSTLSKKNENLNSKYGMDISILAIYPDTNEIHFAGAHHPFYLIRNSELIEFKGDKYSIGTLFTGAEKEFTAHQIFYKPGDSIYLFTDGFVDQIGGNERKKFFYAPFKKLISECSSLAMNEQKEVFESRLLKWKGERDQTDDVLLLGLRL